MNAMKRTWMMIGAATLAVALAACGPKEPRTLSCEEYYQKGLEAIVDEDWIEAREAFEEITLTYPGCERVDDAQYMLGMVYFEQDLFIEAQFEFRRLVEDFRLSDRLEDAQYMLAMCAFEQSLPAALDQTSTEDAIFRLRQYMEDFPQGAHVEEAREKLRVCRERLARKAYNTARFYNRQDYEDAALIYLDHVLTTYPDAGEWVERARFLKARILINRGRRQEALALLRDIDLEVVKPRMRADVLETLENLREGS